MRNFSTLLTVPALWLMVGMASAASVPPPGNVPPAGFEALFNGKDLTGWRGMGHVSPYEVARWSPEERADRQRAADEDMKSHWRVEDGQIINDGRGVYLTTQKDYGDFELMIDWKMTPGTDSGIYLRGSPQVQIWDPDDQAARRHGADKGSGGLWNNESSEGKFPRTRADKPVGQWNTFRIRMIGSLVTVHLNGRLVVDNAVMENYWDRKRPLPARGPIQLQTHGGRMCFANIFIREIPPDEANRILQGIDDRGFRSIFNGRDFDGWIGATDAYEVRDRAIVYRPASRGGTLFTKKQYQDFAIRFEFKLPPAGNNGLAIRSPLEGNPAFMGMEIQILDDGHEKYRDLKPWQVHGSVYGVVPAHRGYLRPVGQWNYEEVIVKGSRIRVNVNGVPVLDADIANARPLDDAEHPGLQRTSGNIGFMGHGDPVEFRNIRLKELK